MERYMRAAFGQMAKRGELTSAHNLGHVQRVSLYSAIYVKAMGGGKKKQAYAKITGWAHDRLRDPQDSMAQAAAGGKTHEVLAAEHMKPLFEKRYKRSASKTILEAMGTHGSLPKLNRVGKNVVKDAVVFADKFFEANGAYIGFRRAMFMGERADLRKKIIEEGLDMKNPADLKKTAVRFTLAESEKRIKAFSDLSSIPSHMHDLVKYQVQWQAKLVDGLKRNDPGTVNLVTQLFAEGLKERPRDLGEMIRTYKPVAETDAAFKKEASDYLSGKLAEKFVKLIKTSKK
ncbi:MAG: hypothetical protein NTZ73_02685 [Candidatus Diapherotrites archaeon]|nr:hypothetical protein [Candidatus Diapherotrites archaeon]